MPEPRPSEETESITRAGLLEIFGALTLATPTWTILRHPFRFDRFKANPGAAIHYLYAAIGFSALVMAWVGPDPDAGKDGGDFAPLVERINHALGHVGPHARLEGSDIIPVMLLIGNLVSGFTAYFTCLWLRRWHGAPAMASATAAETLAATAYLGGASAAIFGIGIMLAQGNADAPPATAAGLVILFLFYCWGRWIRSIHGVVPGKWLGAVFPFALAMLSLLVFAGLAEALKLLLLSL